ncbi:MAG TPA: AMP-binding protein [Chryseosolibacter sp.]|nr:AMP-binding protein [Chryseosolibacter sp.]
MIETPLQCFLKWEQKAGDRIFLRQPANSEWHTYSYRQAGNEIRRLAAYLASELPAESNVAILSKNCAHWLMADLAIMMAGHVSVPVYPTLSSAGINQILTHSNVAAIFLGKLDDYPAQQQGIPAMKKICFPLYGYHEGVLWDDIVKGNPPMKTGDLNHHKKVATIMYSSGTTGTPKGVMLTHEAFGYVGEEVMRDLAITKPERFFSYLPLSHIAERGLMEMVALASGSTISFAESLDQFAENLRHEKPSIFGGVPRIYAKFQEGVLKKIPQQKLERLLRLPIVSSIVKRSIIRKLGLSKAKVIVSGAAPTPVSLLAWFAKLGLCVREVYGMTENTAFSHANYRKIKLGTVGEPWPNVETKISDDGEILIRHKALMKGYYRDPETTAQVFTGDGFLKTGDQGSIDEDGFLTITGRVKDQFKTDKAKFIAPAPIEMKFLANTDIEQVCVVGMGIPQPIALIVLAESARNKSKAEINNAISDQIQQINPSLESYERIARGVVMKNPWTLENGLMTPSLKVKRNEIEKIFFSRYPAWYRETNLIVWE